MSRPSRIFSDETHQDMDSSDSDREEATSDPSRVFSDEIHATLRSLYERGMTGWGKKHSVSLNIAKDTTGLNLSQIKVGLEVC